MNNSGVDEDFAMDEDDYLVITDLLLASGFRGDELERQARRVVGVLEYDEKRRVRQLEMPIDIEILSIPPSIGRMLNLEVLNLSQTYNLSQLPEEIGSLASLIKLNLADSRITSLPASIGRLQKLENLDLSFTKRLSTLPEEIGNLTSLNILDISGSGIESLPPSIGRLQNLKHLHLSFTDTLLELPEEIGELTSLNELNLSYPSIASLPASIVRLENLKDLYLGFMDNVGEFPEDIGEPDSLIELSLDLDRMEDIRGENELFFAVACNKARSQIRIVPTTNPKLWPLLLYNTTRAFDDFISCFGSDPRVYSVSKPDAIYQLLVHGRESFIVLLENLDGRQD